MKAGRPYSGVANACPGVGGESCCEWEDVGPGAGLAVAGLGLCSLADLWTWASEMMILASRVWQALGVWVLSILVYG